MELLFIILVNLCPQKGISVGNCYLPVFVNDSGEYVHVGINRRHFHKFNKCVFAF